MSFGRHARACAAFLLSAVAMACGSSKDGSGFGNGVDGGAAMPDASSPQAGDGGGSFGDGSLIGNAEAGAACVNLQCAASSCASQGKPETSLTGTIRDPAGKLPIYNVYVYVPNSTPDAIVPGNPTCTPCEAPASGSPILGTSTDVDGHFNLEKTASDTWGVPRAPTFRSSSRSASGGGSLVIPQVDACTTVDLDSEFSGPDKTAACPRCRPRETCRSSRSPPRAMTLSSASCGGSVSPTASSWRPEAPRVTSTSTPARTAMRRHAGSVDRRWQHRPGHLPVVEHRRQPPQVRLRPQRLRRRRPRHPRHRLHGHGVVLERRRARVRDRLLRRLVLASQGSRRRRQGGGLAGLGQRRRVRELLHRYDLSERAGLRAVARRQQDRDDGGNRPADSTDRHLGRCRWIRAPEVHGLDAMDLQRRHGRKHDQQHVVPELQHAHRRDHRRAVRARGVQRRARVPSGHHAEHVPQRMRQRGRASG